MRQNNGFSSLQRVPTNSAIVVLVFFCAVFLNLFFLFLGVDVRINLFFLFLVPYLLPGFWGIIFSCALLLIEFPLMQHNSVLLISYLLFLSIAYLSAHNMRHAVFVRILMFFLGETVFFVSYGIGVGFSFSQFFLIVSTIGIHAFLFIPLAFLSTYFLYEK
ncbi:MAG: hypothetical protein HZA36_03230 [Parcubacteria group bacterium]|nr:hypothetical protein [Parcubacteria group bacterium]